MARNPRKTRLIEQRLLICGWLTLLTPTIISNGDSELPTDMALLRDSLEGRALITGSSIAGALRAYLRELTGGQGLYEEALFGGAKGDDDGLQSPLLVADALSTQLPTIELRDGVKIDRQTRVAADQAKYDLEVLAAGTAFPLWFELLIQRPAIEQSKPDLLAPELQLAALAAALQGFEQGQIGLGMKKRRGMGECMVAQWHAWHFDLTSSAGQRAWLGFEPWPTLQLQGQDLTAWLADQAAHGVCASGPAINQVLFALPIVRDQLAAGAAPVDQRSRCTLKATFGLESSLLVRAPDTHAAIAPDAAHLHAAHGATGETVPVLPGTSLAGALRHRAERIVNTLNPKQPRSREHDIIRELFGWVDEKEPDPKKKAQSSRLVAREREIDKPGPSLTQNRIAIDRLTGGVMPGALFSERPLWAGPATSLTLEIEIREPKDYEIGLLLLLLKDLWTGDLPLGGGSNVGRGRLIGQEATLNVHGRQQTDEWRISQTAAGLRVVGPPDLADGARYLQDTFLQPLVARMEGKHGH